MPGGIIEPRPFNAARRIVVKLISATIKIIPTCTKTILLLAKTTKRCYSNGELLNAAPREASGYTHLRLARQGRVILRGPGDVIWLGTTRVQVSQRSDKVRVKTGLLVFDVCHQSNSVRNIPRSNPSTIEAPNGRVELLPPPKTFQMVVANDCASDELENP